MGHIQRLRASSEVLGAWRKLQAWESESAVQKPWPSGPALGSRVGGGHNERLRLKTETKGKAEITSH